MKPACTRQGTRLCAVTSECTMACDQAAILPRRRWPQVRCGSSFCSAKFETNMSAAFKDKNDGLPLHGGFNHKSELRFQGNRSRWARPRCGHSIALLDQNTEIVTSH